MKRSKLKAYLELIRFPLFPIPIMSTLPGVVLASNGEITWRGYLAVLTSLLGYFAGMIKNDYFHSDSDAIFNPDKPIPSGRIVRRDALIVASIIYLVCIALGFFVNYRAGLIVLILIVISHLYNAIFKGKGILGSITLPLGIATMSIFGSVAVSGKVVEMVWFSFWGIFLYDFGAHIATTFKDIEHDRALGIVTTPIQLGEKPALILSTLATISSFAILSLPYLQSMADQSYMLWIALSFGTTAISRIPLLVKQDHETGYYALKGSMIGGIALYPSLIGIIFPIEYCALIILVPYLISAVLLELTTQRV